MLFDERRRSKENTGVRLRAAKLLTVLQAWLTRLEPTEASCWWTAWHWEAGLAILQPPAQGAIRAGMPTLRPWPALMVCLLDALAGERLHTVTR